MFIIEAIDTTNPISGFMTYTVNHAMLFNVEWSPVIDHNTQKCQTLPEAINFLHIIHGNPFFPAIWLIFDIYICELDTNNNIIARTKYSPYNSITNIIDDTIDDTIDYLTPGEALKAHKAGKKVDWKKLAEKY